jgi:hypothetical protein
VLSAEIQRRLTNIVSPRSVMKRTRPTRLLPCAKMETVLIQGYFFDERPVAFPSRAVQDTMKKSGRNMG